MPEITETDLRNIECDVDLKSEILTYLDKYKDYDLIDYPKSIKYIYNNINKDGLIDTLRGLNNFFLL